ncbi:MAG: hypothetical protein WD423_09925 [Rhodothermales bacterium]
MANENVGNISSLEELMERAQERSLLDNWTLAGEDVHLTIGTYEIDVHRKVADRFVRGLLRNYDLILNGSSEA